MTTAMLRICLIFVSIGMYLLTAHSRTPTTISVTNRATMVMTSLLSWIVRDARPPDARQADRENVRWRTLAAVQIERGYADLDLNSLTVMEPMRRHPGPLLKPLR